MKKFLVPVSYAVWGRVEVESESIEQLLDDLRHQRLDLPILEYDEQEYVDDSYELDVDFDEEVRKRLGKLRSYKVGLFNDDDGSFEQFVLLYTMKSKLDDVTENDWKELEQELKNALVVVDVDMNTLYDELVRAVNYMLGRIHNEGLGICYYDLKHIIDPHYENVMSIYETLNEKQREIVRNSHVKGFDENYDDWVELLLYDYESLAEIYNLEKHVIELQEN